MSSSPFLKSIREYMLVRRYSRRPVDYYLHWIKRHILFHDKRHPSELPRPAPINTPTGKWTPSRVEWPANDYRL